LQLISKIRKVNQSVKIVYTVSPVRHWKDGALNNTLSKAHLRIACEKAVHSTDKCFYFPAYELMLDDLRDYRFYGPDLVHPTALAVDYIWEKFQDAFMDGNTAELNEQFEKLSRLKNHRSESEEHHNRLQRVEDEWQKLSRLARKK